MRICLACAREIEEGTSDYKNFCDWHCRLGWQYAEQDKLENTPFDITINHLKEKYETLNFYPTHYDSKWHVSIRDGAIEYRLYPYYKRQDCIDECRVMNKRHNA